jgi:ABC-type multidrug transport system ATPase subunit
MNGDQTLAIEVQNVCKKYKKPGGETFFANKDLSLQIRRGEIFGLLGPNGAGKTTLMLQILGLLTTDSGKIFVEGLDVATQAQTIKTFSGYMPQARVAMRNLEVYRALSITGQLRGQSPKSAQSQSEELIELLDLGAYRNQYLDRLSGGLLRMAALGMALMGPLRVLILDEPTNELDPVRRRLIWDTVLHMNRTAGVTCLLVTHNVLEAEQVIERVAVMERGSLIAMGTPGELKRQLGNDLRLEVIVKNDLLETDQCATLVTHLQELGRLVTLKTGQYIVFVPRAEIGDAINRLISTCGELLDDFRVVPPTLEEVYIHLTGQKLLGRIAQHEDTVLA